MHPTTPATNSPTPPAAPDSLGNPVTFADVAVKTAPDAQPTQAVTNPMSADPAPAAVQQPAKDKDLDKDLTEVNRQVKTTGQKPKKVKNPSTKPTLLIAATVVVTIILIAAAIYAYK